jgi:RNA polymerase sigma-70 factor (ECF subfamily)
LDSLLLEEKFKQLYLQHFEALCRYADFYCSDKLLAKDTVQQVFLRLWESQNDISTLANPRAYLYTSVKHQILNDQRKQQIVKQLDNEDAEIDADVILDLEGKELREKLEVCIGLLPEKRQYIFRLSREEHKSHQEIAEMLDITPKTVENQIGKALKFLKSKIY